MRLLSNLLQRFIREGTLRVRDAEGKVHVFGERLPGPDVAIHLHDRKLYYKLFVNPELYAAEAYMDGGLWLEDGTAIHDFLLLFSVNRTGLYSYGSQKLMRRVWRGLRRWHQANPIRLAAAHAATTTTSRPNFTACSSTIRCNIPALIFETPSMKRSNRRSATS
jgi:cyclopropane-fatty-acyl-phospholipid synthase